MRISLLFAQHYVDDAIRPIVIVLWVYIASQNYRNL